MNPSDEANEGNEDSHLWKEKNDAINKGAKGLYDKAKICYTYKKSLHKCTIDKNYHKVTDHCCYTDKYRVMYITLVI